MIPAQEWFNRIAVEADAAWTELAFFGRPKYREEEVSRGSGRSWSPVFAFLGGFIKAAVAGQADEGEQT